jgi:effector-binding domain-containing protein
MKALKYILFLLLIGIIGFSIFVAVQPNSFEVSRSRVIKAPAAVIYGNVIDFKNWEAWSSWAEGDPDIIITLSDSTRGVGGHYLWEDKDGVGTMTTVSANPYDSIKQQMQFADFPSSDIFWKFKSNDQGGTEVTWSISGKDLPFIFKAFSTVMGGMEKQIAPHYERSLEKLDSIVVNSMAAFDIEINGVTEYGGGFYLFKTINANSANISQVMDQQYGSIATYMEQNNIPFDGMPFTIYHDMNFEDGTVIMSNAIPVKDKITATDAANIGCDYMPKLKVLKATLTGNYTNLGKAWEAAMKHLGENAMEQTEFKPFEIYSNDPGDYPNPADWITEIYIPIK